MTEPTPLAGSRSHRPRRARNPRRPLTDPAQAREAARARFFEPWAARYADRVAAWQEAELERGATRARLARDVQEALEAVELARIDYTAASEKAILTKLPGHRADVDRLAKLLAERQEAARVAIAALNEGKRS